MWPPLSDIKERRRKLGISQLKLAQLSGISQDIISRIESSTIREPSYLTVKNLFEALEYAANVNEESGKNDLTAECVMSRTVTSIKPLDYADGAWNRMKSNNFSQLPVIDPTGKVVGGISETELAKIDGDLASRTRIKDVMSNAFPIVGKSTKLSTLRSLLLEGREAAVIVQEKGLTIGIITKSDLIDAVFSKHPESLK